MANRKVRGHEGCSVTPRRLSASRGGGFKNRSFGAETVELARRLYLDGLSATEIWHRMRDTGVSKDLIRRWCHLGRGYSAAKPPGFDACKLSRADCEWTQSRRIAQLTPSVRSEAVRMAMEAVPLLEIQDFVNASRSVVKPLTGLGRTRWSRSDLFAILFGHDVDGPDVPAGYREWVNGDGRQIRDRVLVVEMRIKADEMHLVSVEDLALLIALEVEQAEFDEVLSAPSNLLEDGFHLEYLGGCDPCELDSLVVSDEEPVDPITWAGRIANAAGQDNSQRRNDGLPIEQRRPLAYVDHVVDGCGCTRQEARRALRFVRKRMDERPSSRRRAWQSRPSAVRSI